jgi:ABC-type iron transport system FetAB ATPase subunit
MKDLEKTFIKLQNDFDLAEPNVGHFERFEAKLGVQDKGSKKANGISWYWLAIAASVILFVGVWFGNYSANDNKQLGELSSKMEETQNFYLATIKKEIKFIEDQKNPQNQRIIDDAFTQLTKLELDHQRLSKELKESNEDKRVIYAMIANFQMQVQVLQNLVEQLEEFNKMNANETII